MTTITLPANVTNYNKLMAITVQKTTTTDLDNNAIQYYGFTNPTDNEFIDYTIAPVYDTLALQYLANQVITINTTLTALQTTVTSLTTSVNGLLGGLHL